MSRLKVIHKAALAILGCCVLATASAFAQTGAKLTDPQIADIVYTANTIDIKNADLALQKSHNKNVRAFAEDMVRDHTAVNNQALALVKKLNVKPEDNATSEAYVKQADAERARTLFSERFGL